MTPSEQGTSLLPEIVGTSVRVRNDLTGMTVVGFLEKRPSTDYTQGYACACRVQFHDYQGRQSGMCMRSVAISLHVRVLTSTLWRYTRMSFCKCKAAALALPALFKWSCTNCKQGWLVPQGWWFPLEKRSWESVSSDSPFLHPPDKDDYGKHCAKFQFTGNLILPIYKDSKSVIFLHLPCVSCILNWALYRMWSDIYIV